VNTKRFEGRLFAEGGCLFMVLATDPAEGTAQVSCRMDGQQLVIDMPLTEVSKRISSSTSLVLDNLNGPDTKQRIIEQENGWCFSAREGLMGPYPSEQEAARALGRYILSMQTVTPAGEKAPAAPVERSTGSSSAHQRRSSDVPENVTAVG
jgi:hypothetical protein